jgi:hypothetical protein
MYEAAPQYVRTTCRAYCIHEARHRRELPARAAVFNSSNKVYVHSRHGDVVSQKMVNADAKEQLGRHPGEGRT